ncbi:CHAD domain-containing protein [Caulobacter sp. UNC279MFTsu5.1]|uniref:CYTH and CHAD domain-containing protein n=1 Tax=Caulobacter sp. UNC279MFTsu5.1 TaxID=1502775 RepID=UPI0008E490F2|nr:CHAD domain-containing protein [Caulobacter sp. UNC279MFTsu5.1]SFK18142.1 Inorganic triphosphatase YgiF, contains CYTH and CHAD domains [Caulobacter sp. UNC279MFTsu5.1]
MDHEIELKFLIAPEASSEILARLEGREAVRQLDATYFDTADHALRKAGFGLRVRDGENGRKQTLKSASSGGVFARGEWENPVEGPEPDRDLLARTPAAKIINGDALTPVFAANVTRVTRLIERDGATIEAALDQGELLADDRRAGISELELELKAGAPRVLFDLARDLAAHAPLRLSLVSKAERGYVLALGEAEGPRAEAVLAPDATVGEALQALGRAALDRLCAAAEGLRTRPGPERVHKLRVAARRFRALLSTFKALAADPAARHVKAELKWLADALGAARNLDVFVADVWRPAVEGRPAPDPADAEPGAAVQDEARALAAFGKALLAAQTKAYAQAGEAVDSARFRALAIDAAAWLEAGAWTTDKRLEKIRAKSAADFARKALDKRRRRIRKDGRDLAGLSPEDRHHLRIRGKKLRYALEDLGGLFPDHPKRLGRFVAATRDLQDALGLLNDQAGREALAREVATACEDPEAAFAAGRLTANGAEREAELLADAQGAYVTFAEAKRFW